MQDKLKIILGNFLCCIEFNSFFEIACCFFMVKRRFQYFYKGRKRLERLDVSSPSLLLGSSDISIGHWSSELHLSNASYFYDSLAHAFERKGKLSLCFISSCILRVSQLTCASNQVNLVHVLTNFRIETAGRFDEDALWKWVLWKHSKWHGHSSSSICEHKRRDVKRWKIIKFRENPKINNFFHSPSFRHSPAFTNNILGRGATKHALSPSSSAVPPLSDFS